MKPSFQTKEEYLQWRAEWRARYRQMSRDIRYLRLYIRAAQSGIGNSKWDACRPHLIELAKKFTNKETGVFNAYYHWFTLRGQAKEMLDWRKESKTMAQQAYVKNHQAAQAA